MKVFNVHAYRFGDRERHSYLVGIFSTKAKAKRAAKQEETIRGGNKYRCEIIEIELDNENNRGVLEALPTPLVKTSCSSKVHFAAMAKPRGTPLPTSFFKGLGSDSAVSRALASLVERRIFMRKARGIYFLIGKE